MTWRRSAATAWVYGAEGSPDAAWLLHADRQLILGVSSVALAIWLAADGARHATDVVGKLVEENDWEESEIAGPVSEFLEVLVEQGLLEECAE